METTQYNELVEFLNTQFTKIENGQSEIKDQIVGINGQILGLGDRVSNLETTQDYILGQLIRMNKEIRSVVTRFGSIDTRV
jgi:hypothetical protein